MLLFHGCDRCIKADRTEHFNNSSLSDRVLLSLLNNSLSKLLRCIHNSKVFGNIIIFPFPIFGSWLLGNQRLTLMNIRTYIQRIFCGGLKCQIFLIISNISILKCFSSSSGKYAPLWFSRTLSPILLQYPGYEE